MGKLSPGITFATNDFVTIAKLYALIDTAIAAADSYPGTPTLFDVVMGDLDAIRAIGTVASPSSPATNDITVGADGRLDLYDGSGWVDLATDYVHLINGSSITLVTGTPVVIDPSAVGTCNIWSTAGVCYEPFGVSGTVVAPSVTAQIMTQGIVHVRINSPITVSTGSALRIASANATALSAGGAESTDVLAIVAQVDSENVLSGVCLGLLVH